MMNIKLWLITGGNMQSRNWIKAVLLALLVLGVLAAAGVHFAGKTLKTQIEQALGADSEVGDISLGLFAVTISNLRIKAAPDWPVSETLRAERITVVPDWKALLSRKIAVQSIKVDGAYLSMLRAPNGKLHLLPSLLEQDKKEASGPPPEVSIDEVLLNNAVLELFDASVRKPAYKVRLENVDASLKKLHLPDLAGESALKLDGNIKGVNHDGTFSLKGDVELASKNSEIVTTLRGVDLMALQPYLIKTADTGVKRGTLDLDIKSTVKKRHLHAPGTVVLHHLELDSGGSFMGMPRQAAIGALKDGKDDIEVKFVLEGNLDDPKFSLNESLATRFGAGLADTLGVSISGLGRSVSSAAAGVGGAIKGLFRR
jgi:hypothetical protein